MSSASDDDNLNPTAVGEDVISTGAAADSADWDEALRGLPRLLRYAALIATRSDHIEQRLMAEIDELCPRLSLNAAWARALDTGTGIALADHLDHLAVAGNEPNLRSLADSVRLLSLPLPSDIAYFEEYRRVGKALIQAFSKKASALEDRLRNHLEGFVFGFAALPACTDLLARSLRAAENATVLASLMSKYRIDSVRRTIWRQLEERAEQRRKEEEDAKAQEAEARRQLSPSSAAGDTRYDLVVARLSDAEIKNTKLKDILAPIKIAINAALPLIEAPPLHKVREALMFEFPYAVDVIDFALADLVGRAAVYIRPLLITGDVGSGKSRFARRLGESLGVNVWRTDATQCDGAVFGGTSRRWYSAEPCHPFLAIVQGGIANPIVLVDEIEKAASRSDYGRLWDTLLGFLEPETNARYPDPALQTNLNLSQVSYIATANRLDPLPSPLRDRFRVVSFPKPTKDDLDALMPGILADLAMERGIDRNWMMPLDGMERTAVLRLWRGGSVRRLRAVVEAILHARDAHAARN